MMNRYFTLYYLIYGDKCINLDAPEPWGLVFQDITTPDIEGLEVLHNNIMYYLAITSFAVGWFIFMSILKYRYKKYNNYSSHSTLVELMWTIGPALILTLIAFPSFKSLYLMDEVIDPSLVIYGEGHQWYWTYQHPECSGDEVLIMFSNNAPGNPMPSQGPPRGNMPGGNFPLDNIVIPEIVLPAPNYADDYSIETKDWLLKVNFNSHVYGTVSQDPFKNVDTQMFHRPPRRITFQAYPGRFPHFSPVKTLPTDINLLEETINTQTVDVRGRISGHNYANTMYYYNKTTDYRRINNAPGWGIDNTIAALERDWERYDNSGFNIVKKVRELRVHESLYRHFKPEYRSQVDKQFFEVD